MNRLYCTLLLLSMVSCVFSQTEKSFSIEYNTGSVFAHDEDVENVGGSTTNGIELKYTFKRLDSLYHSSFNGFPSQGFAIGFSDFNNTILGRGITANYFISPNITINNWLSTAFNFNVGAAYLTNPNRPLTNPDNQSYSTYISAYLAIGWETKIAITKRLILNLGASYRHTSNSGIRLPNKGVNWTTANFGLTYHTTEPTDTKNLKNRFNAYKHPNKNFWEFSMFGAIRNLDNDSPTKYGIAGFQLQHNWQTARTHAFNVGTEFFFDNSLVKQIKIEDNKSSIGVRQGLLLGHQFLWGKLNFGQQIGFHLLNPENKYDTVYHRWTFTHKITSNISAGVSLLAHRQVANFTDVRLVYRW